MDKNIVIDINDKISFSKLDNTDWEEEVNGKIIKLPIISGTISKLSWNRKNQHMLFLLDVGDFKMWFNYGKFYSKYEMISHKSSGTTRRLHKEREDLETRIREIREEERDSRAYYRQF